MMNRRQLMMLGLMLVPGVVFGAGDLDLIKKDPKLKRRAKKALKNAHQVLRAAREAYSRGEQVKFRADLREVQESVQFAYQSLQATGKKPRKHAKPFKRAEISTRELLRRLEDFREEMNYADWGAIDPVISTVRKINKKLLLAVMGGGQ